MKKEAYTYNANIEKICNRFNKKFSKRATELFKIGFDNMEALDKLAITNKNVTKGCYYVHAPSVGLHTNTTTVYFDGVNFWDELGMVVNTNGGLFKNIKGFIPLNDKTFEIVGL